MLVVIGSKEVVEELGGNECCGDCLCNMSGYGTVASQCNVLPDEASCGSMSCNFYPSDLCNYVETVKKCEPPTGKYCGTNCDSYGNDPDLVIYDYASDNCGEGA